MNHVRRSEMTTVFKVIPENFFKVLTSKHKEILLESIFHVDDLLQGRIYYSRENVAQSLQRHFSILDITMTELAYEDEYEEEIKSLQSLSYSILRSLQKYGWIRVNYEEGFTEQVSFPNYANRFIKILRDIDNGQIENYDRYVFSTFSSLKTGLETPENLLAGLESSWNHTRDLQRAIQNAYFELSESYAEIIDELSTNELLKQHFDGYKQSMVEQILYPLKTRDSLPRFKNSILELIAKYDTEDNLDKLIEQKADQKVGRKLMTLQEAETSILTYINDLSEFYRDVTAQIQKIDNKKIDYTEKSIGKIQYRLKADHQLKEKVERLISHTKKGHEGDVYDIADINRFENITEESLYEPRKMKSPIFRQERKKVSLVSKDDGLVKKHVEEMRIMANYRYSSKKVDQFIFKLLEGKQKISTLDYTIDTYEKFIYTIMGAIRGYDKNDSGYVIKFEAEDVRNGLYQVPHMTFIREEKHV